MADLYFENCSFDVANSDICTMDAAKEIMFRHFQNHSSSERHEANGDLIVKCRYFAIIGYSGKYQVREIQAN